MISGILIDEYELKVGPVAFTLAQIPPEDESRVEAMMREVIAGDREAITDGDLARNLPAGAES